MTTKNIRKYTFLTDPGHGWLSVPITEVFELGVEKEISEYSYIKGNRVYLEEDCDAGVFLDAVRAAGYEVALKESHTDRSHPIRNYERFSDIKVV